MPQFIDRVGLALRVLTLKSPTYVLVYDDPELPDDGSQEQYFGFFPSPKALREVVEEWEVDNRESALKPHIALILEPL